MSFIRSGTVKALAITGKTRSPALPDVPDNSEAGIPDVEISSWLALLAPAGTPPAVVDRINTEADPRSANPIYGRESSDWARCRKAGHPKMLPPLFAEKLKSGNA